MRQIITAHSEIIRTIRVQQLEAMFSVPAEQKLTVILDINIPIEERQWQIGLIVGPSGSGKSLTMKHTFGMPTTYRWDSRSVIDDFDTKYSMEEISRVCQSVGFNTIPAWLRPYSVLSNGEKFRVEIARRLLTSDNPILIDEFTSVVDRQIAQIASFAVAKFIRSQSEKQLVAASCHYDIIDWLQPDWMYEPASGSFSWRSLRPRPPIEVEVTRVKYEAWPIFAPFHYMSPDLSRAARCFGLYVNNQIASFCGVLYRPHPHVTDIMGFTRMVTLPDWQGLGLAIVLANTIGAAYKAIGKRLHSYPNHPAWIRSYQRCKEWMQVKESGQFSPRRGNTSTVGGFGGKSCAVFAYIGPAMPLEQAKALLEIE